MYGLFFLNQMNVSANAIDRMGAPHPFADEPKTLKICKRSFRDLEQL
jgi:hypothetical protein